jgi:hypothetical protein
MAVTALLFFGTIAIEVFHWYRKEKLMDGPVYLSQLTCRLSRLPLACVNKSL